MLNPKGGKSKSRSRKGKDGAGASGPVGADDVNLAATLPIQADGVNVGTGLPSVQLNPTEVRVDGAEFQLEHEPERADGANGADGNGRQQQDGLEGEGESSQTGRLGDRNGAADGRAAGPVNQAAEPSMHEVLEVMRAMSTQMLALTQAFTPLGQDIPTHTAIPIRNQQAGRAAAAPVAGGAAPVHGEQEAEVIEIDPPARATRKVDYLKVLEHITRMGTKHFAGSVDPLEADEWRSRLARNFSSSRCPEDYQKDIAVHFLEGDAHNWWLALDKRTNGTIERFEDFEVEFNHKYFPAEAWDRLEAKFLDLVQGRRTVREYEEEFNRLRRYVGKELEDEAVQVRRFIRGLRAELRTYCSVRTFSTVSELVERMALLEVNLADEHKQKVKSVVVASSQSGDRKRKRDQAEEGKTSSGRSVCPKCGRHHGGECWRAMGACLRCGKMDHSARDCPRQEQGAGGDTRTCHYCGKKGHLRKDCPKLAAGSSKGRGEGNKPDQNRGQTSAPRVYELSKDEDKAGPFLAITGNVSDLILFNSVELHGMEPRTVRYLVWVMCRDPKYWWCGNTCTFRYWSYT